MNKVRGFTLIESIVVMVVMALAMVTITSFLIPQVASSSDAHYQTRAAALGQSLMTKILARSFDHVNSSGGNERCQFGVNCSALGIDSGESMASPDQFNDVDDFIGCWAASPTAACPHNLYDLISSGSNSAYHNFTVDIEVENHPDNHVAQMMKKITVTVRAGKQTPIEYSAFRGNY
ncbi:MSHA pilin protein MshD [Vibrio ponticus]|nr:MSHA pilin protein MshD [Vibrio ponticus]